MRKWTDRHDKSKQKHRTIVFWSHFFNNDNINTEIPLKVTPRNERDDRKA